MKDDILKWLEIWYSPSAVFKNRDYGVPVVYAFRFTCESWRAFHTEI